MPSAHAQHLLAARARRVRAIRRHIAAAVVAAFLLAWGVIAGYGPMGTTTGGSQVAATSTSGGDSASGGDSSAGDGASWWDDDGASAGGDAAAPDASSGTLTTGQS